MKVTSSISATSAGCSTAHFRMVVKEEIGFLKNIESCSTVHFHMVVKNVRSIGVC